jgi:WD40 repeat protein
VFTLRGHEGPIADALFSAYGSKIVTSGFDREAKVWDARTGELLFEVPGVVRIALGANNLLAGAPAAGGVRVWYLTMRKHLYDLPEHSLVGFSSDGTRLRTTSGSLPNLIQDPDGAFVLAAPAGRTTNSGTYGRAFPSRRVSARSSSSGSRAKSRSAPETARSIFAERRPTPTVPAP